MRIIHASHPVRLRLMYIVNNATFSDYVFTEEPELCPTYYVSTNHCSSSGCLVARSISCRLIQRSVSSFVHVFNPTWKTFVLQRRYACNTLIRSLSKLYKNALHLWRIQDSCLKSRDTTLVIRCNCDCSKAREQSKVSFATSIRDHSPWLYIKIQKRLKVTTDLNSLIKWDSQIDGRMLWRMFVRYLNKNYFSKKLTILDN